MKFSEFPYTRPDISRACGQYDDMIRRLETATGPECQIDILLEHEQLFRHILTMQSLAFVRNTVDSTDPFYEAEIAYCNETEPVFQDKVNDFYKALLASPFRRELEERFGSLFFQNLEMETRSISPEIIPLIQQENNYSTQYRKLLASAQIPFDGKDLNISQLAAYKESPDRQVRRAAYVAEGEFYNAHRQELDEIFDNMVKNRTEQARRLGFENFIPLGYLRRTRNCYTPDQVAFYRSQVVKELVPIVNGIKQRQAKRIGLSHLKFYDDLVVFPDGNPAPKGTPEEMMDAGRQMYHEMSSQTGRFFDYMMEHDLFDLLAKKGKSVGGYCTTFPEFQAPFIFSNFNGTSDDVDTLTHEAGHAFAAYLAKDIPLEELSNPTMESCEVHSMSMEFLATPWFPLFFGEESENYRVAHLERCLSFIPYGCMVDHFQHIVYANPSLTPAQRSQEWLKLERLYRPYIDFENLPFYSEGYGWQRQSHIYHNPFYYIDYCLAQTIAFQIKLLDMENHQLAWSRYLSFVEKAGTQTFTQLVEQSGLQSPFEKGCIQAIASKLAQL